MTQANMGAIRRALEAAGVKFVAEDHGGLRVLMSKGDEP